jgi:hypothetical protein
MWRRRGRGGSRRDSRSEAEGTPKGLARPRSDSAPKGARGRLRRSTSGRCWSLQLRAEEPTAWRDLARSRRGDPRPDKRSREGALFQVTTRDAAVGEGPLGAARWVGAGGLRQAQELGDCRVHHKGVRRRISWTTSTAGDSALDLRAVPSRCNRSTTALRTERAAGTMLEPSQHPGLRCSMTIRYWGDEQVRSSELGDLFSYLLGGRQRVHEQ